MTAVQQELLRLAGEHGGLLKPEVVVANAAAPTSPLHGCFQWDDSEAAHQYRLWQARQLIRVQVTLLPGANKEERIFVSLTTDRASSGYRVMTDVLSSEDAYRQLLADAKADAERFADRYKELAEMGNVIKAIRAALRKKAA